MAQRAVFTPQLSPRYQTVIKANGVCEICLKFVYAVET